MRQMILSMENRGNDVKKKLGILSLSTVTGAATAITTIIPLIAAQYPAQSTANIESLVTISGLTSLITILLNDWITQKIGLKHTILIGLISGMFFGIFPFFIANYPFFLLTRICLGLAIGLYAPHGISLISYFYSGQERTVLLGMQMGITALGNAILLFLSGTLTRFGWQFTFFVYLSLGLIALLIFLFVPTISAETSGKDQTNAAFSPRLIHYLLLCFVTFLIIWGIQLKLPTYLAYLGIASSEKAGLLLGVMNIAGMLAGLAFGYLYKYLNSLLLPLGYLGAGLSVVGMLLFHGWGTVFVFGILFNFLYSFTGPTIVLKINQLAKPEQLTKANSLIMTATILSSYAAPFFWNTLTILLHQTEDVFFTYLLVALSLFIVGIILLGYYGKTRRLK